MKKLILFLVLLLLAGSVFALGPVDLLVGYRDSGLLQGAYVGAQLSSFPYVTAELVGGWADLLIKNPEFTIKEDGTVVDEFTIMDEFRVNGNVPNVGLRARANLPFSTNLAGYAGAGFGLLLLNGGLYLMEEDVSGEYSIEVDVGTIVYTVPIFFGVEASVPGVERLKVYLECLFGLNFLGKVNATLTETSPSDEWVGEFIGDLGASWRSTSFSWGFALQL